MSSDCDSDFDYENVNFIDEIESTPVARAPRGLLKVDPPSLGYIPYTCRFTLNDNGDKHNKQVAKTFINKYIKKWSKKDSMYMFTYERSKESVPHVHGYIIMDKEYPSSSMTDWMKKNGENVLSGTPGYWHDKVKDINKLMVYIAKDGEILVNSIPDDVMADIREKVDEVKKDMGRTPLEKLTERIKDRDYNHMKDMAYDIIKIYVEEYDKVPPMAQLKGWTVYLWMKLGHHHQDLDELLQKMF